MQSLTIRPLFIIAIAAAAGCGQGSGTAQIEGRRQALGGPVSATPAPLVGVVHVPPNISPTSVQVDVEDTTLTYTATTRPFGATQSNGNPSCPTGSQDYCFTIQVESGTPLIYTVRPVVYVNTNVPYQNDRFPFPPFGPYNTQGPGIQINIPLSDLTYTPAIVTSNISGALIPPQPGRPAPPLPVKYADFIFNDLSNTYSDPWTGSVAFFAHNPLAQAGGSQITAFLEPGDNFQFFSQDVAFDEGGTIETDLQYDYNLNIGVLQAGQVFNADRNFQEAARVSGSAALQFQGNDIPIYNLVVAAYGATTTIDPVTHAALAFQSNWDTKHYTGLPLQSTAYTSRIFDDADFTRPISIEPSYTLSPDGQTLLTFPSVAVDFSQGNQVALNFTSDYATITSRVTLVPPYPIKSGIYPNVQALEAEPNSTYGNAQVTYTTDANGGSFVLPSFGTPNHSGNWNLWRFGWNLDLGDPNFTDTYLIGQFLNIPVQVASGGNTLAPDFVFQTALVKVYFSAPASPAGTTLSDPQLVMFSDDGDSGTANGLNQTGVLTGEARMVLRAHNGPSGPVAFHITPSATINPGGVTGGSRTDFTPFVLFPHGGDVTVVGVPGSIALTLSQPQENQVFQVCQIPVSGLATGQPGIGISVNGQAVNAPSTNNPGDPLQVGFNTTLTPPPGPLTISVTASDGQGHSVTDVRHVTCLHALNQPPNITCPGPGTTTCTSRAGGVGSVSVAISDPDGDPLSVTYAVDGSTVAVDSALPGAPSDTYTGVFSPYSHTVVVTASDGKGGVASCTTSMNVPAPLISLNLNTTQMSTITHQEVNLGFGFSSNGDKCVQLANRTLQIFSNEADVVPGVDGSYSPDSKQVNLPNNSPLVGSIYARAEATPSGSGRVYVVILTALDKNGHTGTSCKTVTVPLNSSPASIAAVNALATAAQATCDATGAAPANYVQVGTGPVIGPYQ